MLSPATRAALQRLVAILLALLDALAAPVDGAPRPIVTRLAIRALSVQLKHLAAQLTAMADDTTTIDPAPTPHPRRARCIHVHHTPPAPRTIRLPSSPKPAPNPLHLKIERLASPLPHAHIVTI